MAEAKSEAPNFDHLSDEQINWIDNLQATIEIHKKNLKN